MKKVKRKHSYLSFYSRLFLLLGIFFMLSFGFELYLSYRPSRLAFAKEPDFEIKNNTAVYPVRIKISSLGIDLPVIPGSFTADNWPTTTKGVTFLSDSQLPGKAGNSIIYGHNWNNIFGSLASIKPGSEVEVELSNEKSYIYTVGFTQVINPNQMYILNNTTDYRLTLYTCIGFLDSKRFVATAFLEK